MLTQELTTPLHFPRFTHLPHAPAYLIDETPAGDREEKKYGRILGNLREIYKKFPDYDLYTTGHSLGGALASLLAFKIAASEDLPEVKRPVTAVSFAAPQVGGEEFNRAYQVRYKEVTCVAHEEACKLIRNVVRFLPIVARERRTNSSYSCFQ